MTTKKIILGDTQKIIIEGIKRIFEGHQYIEIVGEALDGKTLLECVYTLDPDLIIMDISLPDGLTAAAGIKKDSSHNRKVLIFTLELSKEYLSRALPLGIEGYIMKDDSEADLSRAAEVVLSGACYFSRAVVLEIGKYIAEMEQKIEHGDLFTRLSVREQEVFRLLAEGKTIKQIASALYISPKTVESHKYNIMRKLRINSIPDLVKYAIRKNIIQP